MRSFHVSAPTRLHFGLLRTRHPFGGLGAMLDTPRVTVTLTPQEAWSFTGALAKRAEAFAWPIIQELGIDLPTNVQADGPAEHIGLGVGTALGLSVARAFAPVASLSYLAELSQRGERSRIGVQGFLHGGFLLDAGHGHEALSERFYPPADWAFALLQPPADAHWHGDRERAAFDRHRARESTVSIEKRLETIVQGQLLPALARKDFEPFAAALGAYNRVAGEPFAADQGGPYASSNATEMLAKLHAAGFAGAGQSSWGPTLFVLLDHADRAGEVATVLSVAIASLTVAKVAQMGADCRVITR